MGHVPPCPLSRSRPGPHISRRECRRARELGSAHLTDPRQALGEAGERLAVWFLSAHGLTIQESNIRIREGEIDLLATDGPDLVAVEVRTTTGLDDPIDAIDEAKRRRVKRLAGALGANRVDFLGIRLDEQAIDFHWIQN